jgi:hypothetical protein
MIRSPGEPRLQRFTVVHPCREPDRVPLPFGHLVRYQKQVHLLDSRLLRLIQVEVIQPGPVRHQLIKTRYLLPWHSQPGCRHAAVLGVSLEDVVARCESFELDGDLMLSLAGSLLVAEAACRAAPMPVLDWVIEDEKQIREKIKRGGWHTNVVERKEAETSPEWEYHWYRARDRPLHELLRQWCGHRAVSFQERLIAAEAENHRLDVLVAELIDALRHAGSERAAAAFEEEHERDRITPSKARPVIDRPLEISEIPVRYLPARRSWPR